MWKSEVANNMDNYKDKKDQRQDIRVRFNALIGVFRHFIQTNFLLPRVPLLIGLLSSNPAFAGPDDLIVVDIIEESSVVRGRTAYFNYHISISNPSVGLSNVSAFVSSNSSAIRVTDRTMDFGDVPTLSQRQSLDTFAVRVSANTTPDLSQLEFSFSGEEVIDNEDTTPPTISAALSHPANVNGWHKEAVTVSFTCQDNIGIQSCSADVVVNTDGEGQVIEGVAIDTSGNEASTQVVINFDGTPPAISASLLSGFDTPPSDSSTLLDTVSIAVNTDPNIDVKLLDESNTVLATATSNQFGEVSFSELALNLGENTFSVSATDLADNQSQATVELARLSCLASPQDNLFYLTQPPINGLEMQTLDPTSIAFSGLYRQFAGDTSALTPVVPGQIDGDLLTDWVILDGNQFGVLIVLNNGDEVFSGGQIKLTGSTQPTAAALGDFVGSDATDLVVAHQDGEVSIFAGEGNGNFSVNPDETFSHSDAIIAMQAADLNQDGESDLVVLSQTQLHLYIKDASESSQPLITNGNFADGLVGWHVAVYGHASDAISGSVADAGNAAQLFENGSFITSLSQTFTPSAANTSLQFDLQSIFLDGVASGSIPDAVEVSLLDENNLSVVPTFRPEATAFLNITADGQERMASGVSYDGSKVTVDISALASAQAKPATLYFDLIGHPPEQGSTFVVSNVDAGTATTSNDDFSSQLVSAALASTAGAVYCDAVDTSPPILVSDPGNQQILIFTQDNNGEFTQSDTLNQGGQ